MFDSFERTLTVQSSFLLLCYSRIWIWDLLFFFIMCLDSTRVSLDKHVNKYHLSDPCHFCLTAFWCLDWQEWPPSSLDIACDWFDCPLRNPTLCYVFQPHALHFGSFDVYQWLLWFFSVGLANKLCVYIGRNNPGEPNIPSWWVVRLWY